MNKRITSGMLVLVLLLMLVSAPVSAAAPAPAAAGLRISETALHPGDSFTVSLQVAESTELIADASFKVRFDNAAFEVTEFSAPAISGSMRTSSTPAEANQNGFFSASYGSETFEADVRFPDYVLTVTMQVKEAAAWKAYTFEVDTCELNGLDEHGGSVRIPLQITVSSVEADVSAAPVLATDITVTPATTTIYTGDTQMLQVALTPADATEPVAWTSSNEAVAEVDSTGKVTAKAPGQATITASAGSVSAACSVTVEDAPCTHSFTAETKSGAALKTPGTCTAEAVYYYSCAVCGEVEHSDTHTFLGEKDPAAHGTNATRTENAREATCTAAGYTGDTCCTGCNEKLASGTEIPKTVHTPGAWARDGERHWKACTACGERLDLAEHTLSWVTDTAATEEAAGSKHRECPVCGYTCDENTVIEKLPHQHRMTRVDAVASTCTVPGTMAHYACETCGKLYADGEGLTELTAEALQAQLAAHSFTVQQSDAEQHWSKCERCDAVTEGEAHSGGLATCQAKAICEVCSTAYGQLAAHDFAAEWTKDETGHWHACKTEDCQEREGFAAHTPDHEDGATADYAVFCTVCAYEMEAKLTFQATVVGSGAADSGTGVYEAGECVSIRAGSRSGYRFEGWTANDDSVEFADAGMPDTTFVMPAHPVTVTASWTSLGGGSSYIPETYALTFHTNGGSAIAEQSRFSGTTVELSAFVPTREGYTFGGWYADAELSQRITSVRMTGNTNVYAGWEQDEQQTVAEEPFTDVSESDYFADAVLWAVEQGITQGTGDAAFSPHAACTRAQVVTFLWRANGSPEPAGGENPFADVQADAYYYKAALWAAERGITTGTGAGAFSPDAACTREQIVTFLYRAAGSPAASGPLFDDVSADDYCAAAVKWAVEQGVTQGTGDGVFSPADLCTRAQAVTFLYRYMGK